MKRFPCQLAVTSFLILFSLQSMAGLLINPKRIVLEERERAAALDLLNDGVEKARYQIYFEQKIMREDGSIVDLEDLDPEAIYAKDMIRYSPRRVDIEPGGRQTIRVAARRPKDLPEGEYVSHLVFKEIPVQTEVTDKQDDEELSVTLKPTLKIAIPMIVRKGSLSATAGIKDVRFAEDEGLNGAFVATLTRVGGVSLYGSVEVYDYTDGKLGERLAVSKGVGVYTEVAERAVTVRLPQVLKPGIKEFLIRFDEDEKYGGSNLVDIPFSLD